MEAIQPEILKDIFQAKTVPTKMEDWYIETSCIELQQLQLKEIEDRRKGVTSNYQGYYGHSSNSSGRKDPNAMDVDRLSTEEVEQHWKERLCFCCHWPGHIGRNCKNAGNNKQAESKPQDNKKKYRNNTIRKILSALAEKEEQEEQEEPAPKDNNKEDKNKEGKEGKDKQDFQ